MKWRKIVRITHRDIGYLCAGLTIIYAISGIAVNHVQDWNPNYIIENSETNVPPVADSTVSKEEAAIYVITQLGIQDSLMSSFRDSPERIQLFFENKTVQANLFTGKVNIETVTSRAVFRETNFLHLNAPKKLWTYVADLYAVCLALLAITGIFMIRGQKGITGRGKYLVAIGVLVPVVFLIIYF